MTDLERIRHIEEKLGITLNEVSLDKLFTEHSFNTIYFGNGVRNYSIDENENVTGLALDFYGGLFQLEDNYLGNFKSLQKFRLKESRLTDYSFLLQLENLKELDITGHNLSNYDFLKELKGLTTLDLRNNKLSNGDFLKELKGLTTLDLRGNPSLPFPKDVLEDWQNAPKILGFIRDYYAGQAKGTNLPLNEGKVILIGQGNVGKTSLRKCLIEGKCQENEPKTEGLEVVTWDLSKLKDLTYDLSKIEVGRFQDVKLNVWDFGGQEIYHTTHQFFFNSRCLYILVADFDEREEWKTNRIE